MIGLEMAGTSRIYRILWAALALALSCTKEQEGMEPVPRGDYDPVVRFGLETYVGADAPATKTTYAGDDQTYILNSVRYERINWNVDTTDPYIDVVQVKSETDFTKDKQKTVDYKAVKIAGLTNKTGTKDSEADTAPVSGDDKDNLYWSAIKEDRYFYAVYPSPNKMNVPNSTVDKFEIGTSHTATVEGSVSPNTSGTESGTESDREQSYIDIKTIGTPGTPGSPASIEYLPDMTNAYMYAAAKVDGADAGYKKVPLRFKPLFSAIKLMITARDAGAQNYRLKKVELRTDLHCTDAYLRLNPKYKGTALGGKFKATFGLNGSSTGDFTIAASDVTDTLKRLTINIPETERYLLNEDTLKVTFLTLPVEQKYLVVDYTFECLKDPLADPSDPNNWKEVRRFLTLQARNKIFKDEGWYELQKARKLYVRSGIPEIEYFFEVQAQGNLPRTWNAGSAEVSPGYYKAENFYSVKSYRDSSSVLQPLRWEVIDYDEGGTGTFSPTRPTWLYLSKTQDDGTPVTSNLPGNKFVKYSFVEYDAGGVNNGLPSSFYWKDPVSFTYKDLDGNYVHPATYGNGSPDPKKGESYAYDLSSHDIYGTPYTGLKNGDLGTTANCYVVSAPGWYRFPAVYGNAIKGGSDNVASYNGDGGTNRFGAFKNHLNNDIQGPWITKAVADGGNGIVIDGVSILWDDADDLITSDDITKPFYKDDYIYFHVGHIANANAVITATSGGTVVWSWHIWAVANPVTNLATTKIEQTLLNSSGGTFNYQSVYGDNGEFFQTMDLGQNDHEDTEVDPRFCDVRFVQKYKDKIIDTVTVRIRQSGVKDCTNVANALAYQWGRKDPFSSKSATVTCQNASVDNVAEAIMHPNILYRASASFSWSGNLRVDNLWNSKTDYEVNRFAFFVDGQIDGSRKDKEVQKTIYDPCPPGFCVPNLFAFTAFNDKGLYETRTFREYCGTGYNDNTQQHRYTDFYTEYSSTAAGHRNSNGGTIRFYIRGRRAAGNTTNQDGSFDQQGSGNGNTGNYWLAEPGCRTNGEWSYGSAFLFNTISSDNTQGYMIYPVAGSDPDRAKWQRTHGLFVRPMKEQ
ncbi:MAG: hypothetical protein IJ714_06870 [Bacteroidales bacterium]|nr:hypothetical protein [Bacteroidales bacterium]